MVTSRAVHVPMAAAPAQPLAQPRGRERKRAGAEADSTHIRTECRKLCLSLRADDRRAAVRSIGFTSPLGGEGKTFVALTAASVLAGEVADAATYVECNWERPSVADRLGLPPTPGLAEWLRHECDQSEVCHRVASGLTVIPAGEGLEDGAKLCRLLRDARALETLGAAGAPLIVELPALLTSPYGRLAATLVEALVVVAQWGATSEHALADTCAQLEDLHVLGIVLNRERSRIPAWLRRLL